MSFKFEEDTTFLVTGGAGFIGSNLCDALLALGYSVKCLDNFSTGKIENISQFIGKPNFSLIKGDIRDVPTCIQACTGVHYVLHQAAWGSVPRSIDMPLEYEEINIKGTLNMLEAARINGVKRFVYASSSSVYGDSKTLPKTEGEEGMLLSPYAVTKRVNEYYATLYHAIYGLETIGLRYFNVFGKRQDQNGSYAAVIPKFITQILRNEQPVINGDGRQSRDFTYIENVIDANLKACLASKSATGQVFNIACGKREYLIDVYDYICRAIGKYVKPRFGPDRPGDIKDSQANITKARNLLGYEPKWDFISGLNESIRWYMENLQ